MIKNFEPSANIILSSQNREAVFVFKYDGANRYVLPTYDTSIANIDNFFVNGVNLSMLDASSADNPLIALDATTPAVFHVFSKSVNDYDMKFTFKAFSTPDISLSPVETFDVSIFNRPYLIEETDFNLFPNENIIVDNEASYLVLRSNPKFSGNIKLVADSSDNLFLDTFKVSDILSNKKYRKQQVSANSSLSSDIRRVFSSIPNGELYKVDKDNTLDVALPKTTVDKQYNTTYNYGARLFTDELYSEDYSMLAPLWINSKLPDFFAVFRLDGTFNESFYAETGTDTIDNLAFNYVKDANLIKSWSFNPKKNLGKYINSYLLELNKVQSPVFLPLTVYDHNVWNGISVKSGIISNSQETSYQFDKNTDNFTNLNAFISTGFERNNLLCPNLVNLEYAFNDNTAPMYSMHRYFGLYLSENPLYNVFYYKENEDSSVFSIFRLDGSISKFNDFLDTSSNVSQSIFNTDGSIHDDYSNRIFAINNNNVLKRINSSKNLTELSQVSEYCNIVGDNIFSSNVERRNISQFITVEINSTLSQGNHLRVINKTKNIIWEIYSVEIPFPINIDTKDIYCSDASSVGYPIVYRTIFPVKSDLVEQITYIKKAFDSFLNFEIVPGFRVSVTDSSSFSLIVDEGNSDDYSFQHINSQLEISSEVFSQGGNATYLSFFGKTSEIPQYESLAFDASYGPINFEFHGNRNNIIIDFIKTNDVLYSLESDVTDKFQPYMYYQNISGWNQLIKSFDVSSNSGVNNYQYVRDPESAKVRQLVKVPNVIGNIDNKLHVYSVGSLNVSLMGINSVKDFDFSVYDSSLGIKSEYSGNREGDKSVYSFVLPAGQTMQISERNSYLLTQGTGDISFVESGTASYAGSLTTPYGFNTFNSIATVTATTDTTISYGVLDGSTNFVGYKSDHSEEILDNYFNNDSLLKYGLTTPYVSKWVMQGLDCRNNDMRLILDVSTSFTSPVSTNFIPVEDSGVFYNEISFPSLKYLSPDGNSWQDYIYYDLNDVVIDGSVMMTLKDSIFAKPYTDVFSKLMNVSKNINKIKNRTSILSFNKYKNSVDTVYSGLKISITPNNVPNVPNIESYNKYKFGFISTSTRNYDNNSPIEVIINENTKTILMIWYQGSDILNHYYRNSSFINGKSFLSNYDIDKNFTSFYYRKDSSVDGIINNFIKAPVWLNTKAPVISAVTINSSLPSFYDEQISPLVQLSSNISSNTGSIFTAYSDSNSIVGKIFSNTLLSYNNAKGQFMYNYIGDKSTVGNYVINHTSVYESDKNLYADETCDVKLLNKIFSDNNIFYYILRGDKIHSNRTMGAGAFNIFTNTPKSYKDKISTHNGGYFPKFINILEFSSNENSMIINKVEKDFVSGNTNIVSYNSIPQLWHNKVVDVVSDEDINIKRAISHVSNYNVFKSLWDKDYFSVGNSSKLNGYVSSIEKPSFFGSKLIKLPNILLLNQWNVLNSNSSFSNGDVILKFNLSLSVRNIFKNSPVFVSNWAKLQNSAAYIDQYINSTVLNYYNINSSSIQVKLFSKNTGNLSILSTSEPNMSDISNLNFHSELILDNGEYFYLINIKNVYNNLSYYAEIQLTQK